MLQGWFVVCFSPEKYMLGLAVSAAVWFSLGLDPARCAGEPWPRLHPAAGAAEPSPQLQTGGECCPDPSQSPWPIHEGENLSLPSSLTSLQSRC